VHGSPGCKIDRRRWPDEALRLRWNASTMPADAGDHRWEIVLSGGGTPSPIYQIGFYHFERAGAALAEGPLAAVRAAGQATATAVANAPGQPERQYDLAITYVGR
jgi:hypothetical protein